MKSVLITGVSTGIGYGTTQQFLKNGYRVFGSVRKQEDADRLSNEFGNNFIPLLFDITNEDAVKDSVGKVEGILKGEGLTGLINNAGEAKGAPLAHVTIKEFKKQLDTLVVGQLIVTQAFLPLLGAQKDCPFKPGKIINISSVSGKMASPFMGPYIAAKHALEGLSNTLRIELQIYGIDVIIVGPGMIKTPIWDKNPEGEIEQFKDSVFYEPYLKMSKFFRETGETQGYEQDEFCEKLFKIFEIEKPKIRYAVVKNRFKNWTIPMFFEGRPGDKFFAKALGLYRT